MVQLSEHLTLPDAKRILDDFAASEGISQEKALTPLEIASLVVFVFEKGVIQGRSEK